MEIIFKTGLLLGTAQYPNLEILQQAVLAAKPDLVTVSLKREKIVSMQKNYFYDTISALGIPLLPNTAGCRSAQEAVTIAEISRELFQTSLIKLEVTGNEYLLAPDPFELVIATEQLLARGFTVLPFCTQDIVLCQKLYDLGCRVLMPWGAPIGSGLGLLDPHALQHLRAQFPDIKLVIDAGIGNPIHALQAIMLGYDAVLVNSAIAKADDPVNMAIAFKLAIESGRLALAAGVMSSSSFAQPSTVLTETLFWGSR